MPKKEYLNDKERFDLNLLKSTQKTNDNLTINSQEFSLSNSNHNQHLQKLLKAGLIKKHPIEIQATGYNITKKGLEQIKSLNQAKAKQDDYNHRYLKAFSYYLWIGTGLTLFWGIIVALGVIMPIEIHWVYEMINNSINFFYMYVGFLVCSAPLLLVLFLIVKALIKHHFHVGSFRKVDSSFYNKYFE